MKNRELYRSILLVIVLILGSSSSGESKEKGKINIGYETYNTAYVKDEMTKFFPNAKFSSHQYLNIKYSYSKFFAGIQYEGYFNPLPGYPTQLNGNILALKYIGFKNKKIEFVIGDYYEQFGSGLIFKSWEDRALGLNNSLEGIKFIYTPSSYLSIKTVIGRPRIFKEKAPSWITGLSLNIDFSKLMNFSTVNLNAELSVINKREDLENESLALIGVEKDVTASSLLLNFGYNKLSINSEIVVKSKDVATYNLFSNKVGYGVILGAEYTDENLSTSFTLRRLSNFAFHSKRNYFGIYDAINYLPSLTYQHSYKLASLNPYQSQPYNELGFQLDTYFNFFGDIKLHTNISSWFGTTYMNYDKSQKLLFRELAIKGEKRFSKNFKFDFLYSYQGFNPEIIGSNSVNTIWNSHCFVNEFYYKYSKKTSIRTELQFLYTRDDRKSWVGALFEINFAPIWSVYVSDYWNYNGSKINYYNIGAGCSLNKIKINLSAGRFIPGYQCSGGMCRMIPEFSGVNLNLIYNF